MFRRSGYRFAEKNTRDQMTLEPVDSEGPGKALNERDDLARVHDALRVERLLECPHGGERGRAVLAGQILHLALADSVLARAGSLHGERALDQALAQPLG